MARVPDHSGLTLEQVRGRLRGKVLVLDRVVYLIRHCRATDQQPDAPLTEDGREQAERLADVLEGFGIARIVSSPFVRAVASIEPLARRVGLPIGTDARLSERVLSDPSRPDWLDRLRESFDDLDLCLDGGESSRTAMARGRAVLDTAVSDGRGPIALVTHGNLLALLLRSFDGSFGFDGWRGLANPDLYRVDLPPGPGPARLTRLAVGDGPWRSRASG